MIVLAASFALLALLGHWSFCLWLSNTINALGWSRGLTKLCSKPVDWFSTLGTLAFLAWLWQVGAIGMGLDGWQLLPGWLQAYAMFASGVAVLFLPR